MDPREFPQSGCLLQWDDASCEGIKDAPWLGQRSTDPDPLTLHEESDVTSDAPVPEVRETRGLLIFANGSIKHADGSFRPCNRHVTELEAGQIAHGCSGMPSPVDRGAEVRCLMCAVWSLNGAHHAGQRVVAGLSHHEAGSIGSVSPDDLVMIPASEGLTDAAAWTIMQKMHCPMST